MKREIQFLACACVLAMDDAASAQSMNIDLNQNGGIPSNAYGGVLNQPGHWNSVASSVVGGVQGIWNLDGVWTGTEWNNNTGNDLFLFNDPGTSGDVEALMDDGFALGGAGSVDSFTINILQNGLYNIAIYAWTPGTPPFSTSVAVNDLASQNLSGLWPGQHQLGVTYALFENVEVTNFSLTITTSVLSGQGVLNGVQLQLIPAPGALGLLGAACLCGLTRRRR